MPWHPALPFFYSPSFPWSNLLLHSGRGNRGSGQDSCSPQHSGSSLLSTAEVLLIACYSWQGMSSSPEASPSDPILRSGLPECSVRALSPVTGGLGSPRDGGIHPYLLLLGVWPGFLQWATPVSELHSLRAPPPGEGCEMGQSFSPRLLSLRSHMLWSVEVLYLCLK